MGTTAERLLRQTTLPLLIALQVPSAPYDHTLLALDFDDASRAAALAAWDLGVFEHTTVAAAHVVQAPSRRMMQRSMATSDQIELTSRAKREGRRAPASVLVRTRPATFPSSPDHRSSSDRVGAGGCAAKTGEPHRVGPTSARFRACARGQRGRRCVARSAARLLVVPVSAPLKRCQAQSTSKRSSQQRESFRHE